MTSKVKFKVVILGSQDIGKTCLSNRIVNDQYSDKYVSTVGGIFKGKFCSSRGQTFQVGIWDTVGTERYRSVNQSFYRGSEAAIVCYDISDKKTWDDVKYWVSELRCNEDGCKIYLCGTKKDLVMEGHRQRDISFEVTSNYAAGIQSKLFEVSSKTGENVAQLFQTIVDDYVDTHSEEMVTQGNNVVLTKSPTCRRFSCCLGKRQ